MVTVLDGITTIAILVIVSSGLALILGLMNVINLAHPGLMAIGAYGALEATRNGIPPLPAMLVGTVAAAAAGYLMELLLVRRLYHRPLDTILATWGLALVIANVLLVTFGREAFPFRGPVTGLLTVGGFQYSAYRLVLLAVAIVLVAALLVTSQHTKVGLMARAVMANEDLAQGLGLNTRAIRRWTFTLGAALAGASGALIAPLAPVSAFMGMNFLIPAFLTVLLAGNTVWGLVLAAVIFSGSQTLVSLYINPIIANVAVAVLAVVLLRFLPNGFQALRRTG